MSRKFLLSVLCVNFFCVSNAFAVSDIEKKELSRLMSEIKLIQGEVKELSLMRKEGDRHFFDYELLNEDLEVIRAGIETELNSEFRPMPKLERIRGEYSDGNF